MDNIKTLKSKDFYKLLTEVYREVNKTKNIKEALSVLVELTSEVIGCERGSLFLYDEKTAELYSFIAQGSLQHEIRVMSSTGIVGWSFTNNQSLIIDDAYSDPRFNNIIDKMTGFQTKGVLCVPLISVSNELIGVTQMLNKKSGHFTEHDIQLVKALTEQAALAIQSKLAIEHMDKTHKKELEFLEAISKATSEIQISALLDKIIIAITYALDAERATLFVNDNKTNELYTEASIGLEKKEIRFQNHLGIAGHVFTSGEIINIPYAYADLRFNPSFDRSTGFFTRSILTAPVKNKSGKIVGVTQVLNKKYGTFNNDDISQLVAINSQISMAIENATLFDDVQNIKNYNESILESMTNAVVTINDDGGIVTCNKSGLRILNVTSQNEILNQDAVNYFLPISTILAEKIKEHHHTRQSQDILMELDLNISGEKIVSNITILPLTDVKKNKLGIMVMIEDISKEKRMKATMSRYMSSDLADQLLSSDDFTLGGSSITATILFSDIRNFTTITESIGPEETVKMLNEYFTVMVDCIQSESGMLDKFIGDAIMAVFGTPFTHNDDPDRGVRAAIAMMKALKNYNAKREKRELPIIHHGIGINTDKIVSGNIGSEKRMDFTVIGDGVNLASRIEGLCKEYGANILISESTYHALKATYRSRQIDKVIVKGKSKPIIIYEIIDHHDEVSFPNQIKVLNNFANGVEFYNKLDWDNAINSFEMALSYFAEDKPSQIYLARCRSLKINPPGKSWNGVWVMGNK